MRYVTLTKIDSDRHGHWQDNDVVPVRPEADTDEPGENQVAVAPPVRGPVTRPVEVNVDAIRCFYPRNDGRPGTRITFKDGGGFAVTELFDHVKQAVRTDEQDNPTGV